MTLLPNPCSQVKFIFTARCAGDMESIGIETTDIAWVVHVLLISVLFLAIIDHCAMSQVSGAMPVVWRRWSLGRQQATEVAQTLCSLISLCQPALPDLELFRVRWRYHAIGRPLQIATKRCEEAHLKMLVAHVFYPMPSVAALNRLSEDIPWLCSAHVMKNIPILDKISS